MGSYNRKTTASRSFLDFPGCAATGVNKDDAIQKADKALSAHIGRIVSAGKLLPMQRDAIELLDDPRVKRLLGEGGMLFIARYELPKRVLRINISMEEGLVQEFDAAAEATGLSRSAFLAEAARVKIRGPS
jgi:predicted RNase H-like HicB family nuclease